MTSSLDSALALRKDLLFVVTEVQNHSSSDRARSAALAADLNSSLSALETEVASVATSASHSRSPDDAARRRCEGALRAIFLRYTRTTETLDEADFIGIVRNFRVIPVLINEAEAVQAFRAKAKGKATMKEFLEIISICALAFGRPPHNAKPGTSEIHLWRFLGLTDGAWRKRLPL